MDPKICLLPILRRVWIRMGRVGSPQALKRKRILRDFAARVELVPFPFSCVGGVFLQPAKPLQRRPRHGTSSTSVDRKSSPLASNFSPEDLASA
jgi:hypothetical protein